MVERSFPSFAGLDAGPVTVLRSIDELETQGGHCLKLYMHKRNSNLNQGVVPIVRQMCQWKELWKPGCLQISAKSKNENDKEEEGIGVTRKALVFVHSARMQMSYVDVELDRFAE